MRIKPLSVVAILALAASPIMQTAAAQDLPTDQLERHADVVRQDALLRSNLRHSQARRSGGVQRPTPRQRAICAQKGRFRSQHGADHPKVQKLYDLCRQSGL